MNANLKFLFCGAAVCFVPQAAVAQCVATTDCVSLGYTQTSCPNGKGLKCPFGNTFACPMSEVEFCEKYGFKYTCVGTGYTAGSGAVCNKKYAFCSCSEGYEWKNDKCQKKQAPEKAVLGQCNGYAKNCQLGWLLNSDGTCTTDKVSGKTPIGVIVYLSLRGCGQAMTAESIVTGISWASSEATYGSTQIVVGTSVDLGDYDDVMASYDGYENTLMIINKGDKTVFPAAWAAYEYTPNSVPETKGKWFLPAVGVLQNVYNNLGVINRGINNMGGIPLEVPTGSVGFLNETLWSSSEHCQSSAWYLAGRVYDIGVTYERKNYGSGGNGSDISVRPVIEF